MFDFLNRLGGARHPASPQQSEGEAPSNQLRHYQPERHYMRGPGPKWQEKHAVVVIVTRQAPLSHRLQAA